MSYLDSKDKKNINLVRLCGEMTKEEIKEMNLKYHLCGDITVPLLPPAPPIQQPQLPIQQPVNIMVAVPTGMNQDFEWARDFYLKLMMRMCPPNSGLIFEARYGIAQAREALVNTFIQSPIATHLLFFDTDILPIEIHGVKTLIDDTLADPKKYIVSGIYYNSLYTGINAWINEVPLKMSDPIISQAQDPVIPVDKVGMGYCIIRRDLFSVLNLEDRPLFFYKVQEGNVMESEDFTFFKKLKKYGIRPYIDTRVTAQHIKRCKVNPDGSITF